jgi:exonuclease VII small subunit
MSNKPDITKEHVYNLMQSHTVLNESLASAVNACNTLTHSIMFMASEADKIVKLIELLEQKFKLEDTIVQYGDGADMYDHTAVELAIRRLIVDEPNKSGSNDSTK